MNRVCSAPGCGVRTTSRFSSYCSAHKARLRRHGAPDQEAITKSHLAPYAAVVRARIEKNRQNTLWEQLERRWEILLNHARSVIANRQSGRAGSRHEYVAALELLKLEGAVPAQDVIVTVLAMFVMLELEPRRFRSDPAFRAQLVRRVRGLTDMNAGEWHDHKTGKIKRAYRDLPPRSIKVLGQWLADTFGVVGLHLAKVERSDEEKRRQETRSFFDALSQIS